MFRGEFAKYISYAFPERKLYLFDTFEGFDIKEALKEKKNGNCSEASFQAYKSTNIGSVLDKMTNLDNVYIKQGYFPDSLDGLEENFAFVSIDVDLEESIYQALSYFYPRLSCGGYIFIHDYTSSFKGVKTAVDRYEENENMMLCRVPICDSNGTLVITK